jgi:hypothetical protein
MTSELLLGEGYMGIFKEIQAVQHTVIVDILSN